MIVRVKRHLDKCDLSEAKLFLYSTIGTKVFSGCDNFGELLEKLQHDHVDVFNISILQQLVDCFDNYHEHEVIESYNEKKESFLKHTTVLEFQRAVVSRVEPILASGMAVVIIKVPKKMARHRTLKHIEELAMEGFEDCHKKFIRLHAEPGSIIISWIFPKRLSGELEQLARDNAAVFEDFGVVEVTVGGKRVFPCTQQEDMASSQGVSEKEEEESKLKQLYTEFYQQLVEAVSDPDTCHSLTTQLHSTSILSEEKKAALSSSLASGSSYLKVLGVEEEPHLLTVLMEKMSTVKQLQTLSEDMSGWLSGSKQEQQQFERLTSDNADLLTKLERCNEDLKTANELLSMKEKAISGMMAAVRRRDTDVEEREERISHLKKELEKLRREGVESGERESLLTREIEDLKSKLGIVQRSETVRSNSKIILVETTAPPDCPVELIPIPTDLDWKFFRLNPDITCYWVKLIEEESYRPPLGMGIREHSADRHHQNVCELKEKLKTILGDNLIVRHEFKFTCEARLGRLAWRSSEADLHKGITLSGVCVHRYKEFYTRTTTKADDMIEKLQSCCSMDSASPRNRVTFQVKGMDQKDNYRVILEENPPGTFTLTEEGCTYPKTFASNKADIVCIGRSHDVRIASDCKSNSLMHKPVPPAAMQIIEKIAKSAQRTDTGELKMILMSGFVQVEHVRQKKSWSFTTRDEHFGVSLCELKETNTRSHFPREDELVTLEYNTNQEIEVKMTKEIKDQEMIPEILDRVEKLVDFALDVVDMAEECRDPAIPY